MQFNNAFFASCKGFTLSVILVVKIELLTQASGSAEMGNSLDGQSHLGG
jgi:hypothetical protein